ncbi:MAG: c-type cytochrome [Candidatus Eiseniibacteriota bacterium]
MKLLRRIGIALGVLVVLIVVAAIVLYMIGGNTLRQKHTQDVAGIDIPDDSLSIAEGRRYAQMFACTVCHDAQLQGSVMIDDPVFGRMVAPHIGPGAGSVTASYEPEDWVRAIRHGIGSNGRPLVIMPSSYYTRLMAPEDLGRIVAAIRNGQAVDHDPGKSSLRLAQVLLGAGVFKTEYASIDHAADPPAKPDPTDTLGTGRYVGGICTVCHGPTLMGNKEFGGPPLVRGSVMDTYDEEAFRNLFRTGQARNGRKLDEEAMPWKELGQMTEGEMHAVWTWIRTVPPTPTTP